METLPISENLKAHFLRLYQMAICDDEFNPLELKTLYNLAEERGVSSKSLDEILLNPINSKLPIPETIEEKVEYLLDLTSMIWADGVVSEDQYITLKKYISMFGFLEENTKDIADYLIEAVKQRKTKTDILNDLKS